MKDTSSLNIYIALEWILLCLSVVNCPWFRPRPSGSSSLSALFVPRVVAGMDCKDRFLGEKPNEDLHIWSLLIFSEKNRRSSQMEDQKEKLEISRLVDQGSRVLQGRVLWLRPFPYNEWNFSNPQSNWSEVYENFDDMNLKEALLRGIYAYG